MSCPHAMVAIKKGHMDAYEQQLIKVILIGKILKKWKKKKKEVEEPIELLIELAFQKNGKFLKKWKKKNGS